MQSWVGGFTVSSWENRKLNQTASQTLIIKRISHSDEPTATQPSVTGDIWVEELTGLSHS